METHGTDARAQLEVRGPTIDELWQLVRRMTEEPVTLEFRPYFVDTPDGRCDLEEVPYGIRVSCSGARSGQRLDSLLERLRAG